MKRIGVVFDLTKISEAVQAASCIQIVSGQCRYFKNVRLILSATSSTEKDEHCFPANVISMEESGHFGYKPRFLQAPWSYEHERGGGKIAIGGGPRGALSLNLNERSLSILVNSLFSAWMLAFLFEGRILYALVDLYALSPRAMVFGGIAAMFSGLLFFGLFIKTKRDAKRLYLSALPLFIFLSLFYFFPPNALWTVGITVGSFLAGGCVAAWGFYLKSGTPRSERIKTVADMLILSNGLMILLNTAAVHLAPRTGLALSLLTLAGAFYFALKLPADEREGPTSSKAKGPSSGIGGLLAFLCLFIVIITINSGLMYEVVNPAFTHLDWLTSWYWATPYIVALFVMRNLSSKISRTYILYVAIAMIGFSFIGFMCLDHSAAGYLVINTLMLAACGIFDLFWWSILGEMLDFHQNPATVLGIGLSANVFGVLLGGLIGSTVTAVDLTGSHPMLLALAVVCVTLALLPPLTGRLSVLLRNHAYLTRFIEMPVQEQAGRFDRIAESGNLSEREKEVASLLLQGKTYRAIAAELFISENTVKYYVKNIYSKLNIQRRGELIDLVVE